MSESSTCICCEKEIFEEQDYTTLICHAAGQTISHTTLAHDKCWEKFKKSFVRGRGTSSRTQTFFCPVAGCHNALQHQHLSVRKKTHTSGSIGATAPKKADGLAGGDGMSADGYTALPGLDGAPRLPAKQVGAAGRLMRDDDGDLEEEDDSTKCQAFKQDGTRCGRPVFDQEFCACKLHVDQIRKQRDFAKKAAEEAAERERQAELELAAARERPDDEEPDTKLDIETLFAGRNINNGFNIEIGDGPAIRRVDPAQTGEDLLAKAAAQAAQAKAAEALKPAKWAAVKEGTNQKKAWNAAVDKTGLEDCPVCLEEPGDIEMRPCGHTCCGNCLDQWMATKSSFAQTLRTGSSETTCPLCRADVKETVAAKPLEGAAAAAAATGKAAADPDAEQDWVALAKQRHAEVVAKARAVREASKGDGPEADTSGAAASTAPGPSAPKVSPAAEKEPKPSNASKWGISAAPANGGPKASPWGAAANGGGSSWSSAAGPAALKNGSSELKAPEDRGPRVSDGAEVDAVLPDAMQARLAAVIDDDDDVVPPPAPLPVGSSRKKRGQPQDDPWTQEEERRRKEQEEAKAHAAWMKAQTGAKKDPPKGGSDASPASQGDSKPSSQPDVPEVAGGKKPSPPGIGGDGWGAPPTSYGGAFGGSFGGLGGGGMGGGGMGAFGRVPTKEDEARLTLEEEQLKAARKEASEAKEQASRATAHVDMERQAAEMLRTELASVRDQLVAEQEARTKDHKRAEQAEATVEVLKQQLTAFQEQLNRMRKTERAKDEEYRRLQDEHRSLARAQEEAKASVMKMWDQLEKKDQEVDALKSKLHGGQPGPPHGPMQGGPGGPMRGMPPGPGQMNGYPNHPNHPNHPGMMQRPPHMQPQGMPRPQPHQMQPRPQHPGQYGGPPGPPGPHGPGPNGQPGPARPPAAAQVMQRGWKCAHCTFLNQNAPILDPHTKQHKGFCEICEGVTTLFGNAQ